ncbi:glycoside hydrolase family 32 protein [Deinococcus sp. HMF7604]|uniref:glycoside hydrolase family 32 protein n=1 Tax=Deinococcus betulae TaxID=2873312 RepID=UPI001CC94F8F|nr:glycoside hydrolase family 32 protein [Deinococcus betulae]MBZ9750001.1 glycoside hydrolase family 32 protein [Deinococcus betulae]
MVLRPALHFTARQHWLNDPNGLVYAGGHYHLFYQHNPRANHHGYLSWGHATSPDLLHWQEHEVALPWRQGHDVYSGSAVVDRHNTSGLGQPGDPHPPVVAMYTGNGDHHQAQYLALSRDGGAHWAFVGPTAVLDEHKQDFRDPKTFWHAATAQWISVVAHPNERQIGVYGSPDLRRWTRLSLFGPAGAVAGIWEVPDLFALPSEDGDPIWVMKVDVFAGGPQGGTGAQYWVGTFDGAVFTPSQPARWADWGKDFYAAITYSDLPQGPARAVWLAWMNAWDYANDLPTHPWRGALTLPRELGLVRSGGQWALIQQPLRELTDLRDQGQHLDSGQTFSFSAGQALDLALTLPEGAEVHFRSDAGQEATLSVQGSHLRLTRPAPAGLDGFAGTFMAPLPAGAEGELRVILDTCSLEVFAAGGQVSFTSLLLSAQPITRLTLQGAWGQLWRLRATLSA